MKRRNDEALMSFAFGKTVQAKSISASPGGSVVERVLGKDEVAGSIPALGSKSCADLT